ncbi:MAG: PHP domain-containing protein, partial [Bacilli bacterium]|nr:PHP domain-containing protein [Bacilli bacterium]
MNEKMNRFLNSIGILDVEYFSDLSFEVAKWDSNDKKLFCMTIKKNSPWDPELLEEFKQGLDLITYRYVLRFSYVNQPRLIDVKKLFESWQFTRGYFDDFFFKEKDEQTLIIGTSNPMMGEEKLHEIAKDFGEYLKWLSYPFFLESDINLMPRSNELPVEKQVIEELTPIEEPTPMIDEEPKEEPLQSLSYEEKGEPDETDVEEAWSDKEEEERQQKLREAEAALLIAEENMARAAHSEKFTRRGNYTQLTTIEEIFQMSGGNIEVDGTVFEPDFRTGKKGTLWGKFGLGDDRSAIYVRASESKNGLSAEKINSICAGKRIKVRGSIESDQRTGATQIYCHYIDELPPKPLRDDPEEEKRVELHLHTKMSAMDAPGDIHAYGKLAKNMGMKAIAVTDHGVIQAFPEAERMSKAVGIKVLYGCEFYMFDHPRLAWNPCDTPLLKAKYCVFDFETTGLSSRYDHITEFGGVIVENGMVTETKQFFVNPGVHIPDIIQQKTHITDDMVTKPGTPNEIEAARLIKEFAKDAIFVSHNAAFDIGFLNKINEMAGYGKVTNPVIDTLAISRFLFPEARAHRLGNLSKNLGLEIYDDQAAHRADYDADVLNKVWQVVIGRLTEKNKGLTQRDLTTLRSSDHNFFKHLRSNHIVALAKNAEGLKALYRLISKSHTEYLATADVPKILRDELVLERDNLLLGSACCNGEIWEIATRNSEEDLLNAVSFYDYVEVQPKENYSHLVSRKVFTKDEVIRGIKDIVDASDKKGVMVCATGDCHYVNPEDKILRDIYINMKGLGGRNHPLKVFHFDGDRMPPAPDQHFRSTREMMDSFASIFDKEKCKEIIVTNTNKIADMCEEFPVLKDRLYGPQANLPDSDVRIREVCYGNLHKKYGPNPE